MRKRAYWAKRNVAFIHSKFLTVCSGGQLSLMKEFILAFVSTRHAHEHQVGTGDSRSEAHRDGPNLAKRRGGPRGSAL